MRSICQLPILYYTILIHSHPPSLYRVNAALYNWIIDAELTISSSFFSTVFSKNWRNQVQFSCKNNKNTQVNKQGRPNVISHNKMAKCKQGKNWNANKIYQKNTGNTLNTETVIVVVHPHSLFYSDEYLFLVLFHKYRKTKWTKTTSQTGDFFGFIGTCLLQKYSGLAHLWHTGTLLSAKKPPLAWHYLQSYLFLQSTFKISEFHCSTRNFSLRSEVHTGYFRVSIIHRTLT